ncbi:cytochrome c3 family protein [Eggerthella sinensis]|uniref:cytochrome c3 family protein n=1 Tax=Eggerthella sinensis TaxID=242230 RepID=UPI00248DDD00|nr:cytochrome c3 family protein [Eggerthella sinensis]
MRSAKIGMAAFVCAGCLVAALAAAGCTPQAPSSTEGGNGDAGDQPVAVAFTWSAEADCAMCHAKEDASMTDASCLAATHEQEGNTCSTCHTDVQGLTKAHESATPEDAVKKATKLRDTTIDEDACFSCHGSYDELAEKTASSTLLTDSQGTVVNPHARPDGEGHADQTCADCHVMHSDEPVTESAPAFCISCHHAGVYQCNTCHA